MLSRLLYYFTDNDVRIDHNADFHQRSRSTLSTYKHFLQSILIAVLAATGVIRKVEAWKLYDVQSIGIALQVNTKFSYFDNNFCYIVYATC
ncbi:uncharacterized protein DC041_0003911 [Schistosoma bovis]|uniref:Uncharacterized protein n=1 Tax=Schistosoma bovis TaxID=6184 RepID=A0A430QNT7_SCHBO|nr:uncharacterized protein DC041_0003911 [Schistosoma bovis]